MRHRNKTKSMKVVLRIVMVSLFVLGLSNEQNVEGFGWSRGGCGEVQPVDECGVTLLSGYFELTGDLTCVGIAITIDGPAKLDLKGHTLSGTDGAGVCILIRGDGATVWNGTVENCEDGIYIRPETERNRIIGIKSRNNSRRGFNTFGDANLLFKCSATDNGRQGFVINGGNGNKIFSCKTAGNGRDGIEIRGDAANNWVFFNRVEDNGSGSNPSSYAGIDVQSGSENNKIKFNYACENYGCDDDGCGFRNFWDENVDADGNCVSSNEWKHNAQCWRPENFPIPECTSGP